MYIYIHIYIYIYNRTHICKRRGRPHGNPRRQGGASESRSSAACAAASASGEPLLPLPAPNLPEIPAKTCLLKASGKFHMDMKIPTLNIKILLESNPLKSRILVRRLAVSPKLSASGSPLEDGKRRAAKSPRMNR